MSNNNGSLSLASAKRPSRFKRFISHPMSSFVIFGVLMVALQVINVVGKQYGFSLIKVSTMTAIGSVLIYSIISVGFCLLLGYSGLASLGTAGFIGIGAYFAYFCFNSWGLPYIVCFALTLVVSILIGVAVGFISLRIEGIYLAIITLGLAEIMRNAFQAIKSTIKIDLSNIKLLGMKVDKTVLFYLIVVTLVLLIWIVNNLINSPTGRAMLAMKNSTAAAQAYGISLMKYRLLAFVISTCYAAIAGILYMLYFRAVTTSESALFKLPTSLNILGAVIIGGAKSIWGAVAGTFLIFGFDSLVLQNIPFFRDNPTFISLFTGVLIIVVVMLLPGGLAQIVKNLAYKIKLRRAKKGGEQ